MQENKKKRKPKEERRKVILDLSKKVFAKYGYIKTTMDDISREIGFTPAAIYYYFDSKKDLFEEGIKDEIGKLITKIEESVKETENPVEKIKKFAEVKIEGAKELIRLFNMTEEIVGELKSEIERLKAKELGGRELKLLDSIIKEGIEKKVFRAIDTRQAAFLILSITKELAMSQNTKKKDIDDTLDIILKGLLAEK